jgi:hypothetical protein
MNYLKLCRILLIIKTIKKLMMANQFNSNLIYDLDGIKDFIFGNENGRSSDVEITETQVRNDKGQLETESRVTREVKSTDSNRQTIRYDMIKMFMDILDNVEIDQEIAPLSLGQKMVLNTMGSYGLIKQIEE